MSAAENHALVGPSFDAVYSSVSSRDRAVAGLKKLASSMPRDAFRAQFLACVDKLLPEFKKDAGTERVVELVVHTVRSINALEDLTLPLLDSLIKRSQAKDKGVRMRCTQLLAGILKAMAESSEEGEEDINIPEDVLGRIEAAALTRCGDKIPSVRVEAARLLELLQNPSDIADPATKALIKLLRFDESKDVRAQACRSLCITATTVSELVTRCRDENDVVRVQVFRELATRVPMTALGLDARATLLDQGLGDRSPKVQRAGAELLKAWLGQCGNDVVSLLEQLDVEVYEDVAVRVIKSLLEDGAAMPSGDNQGVARCLVLRVECEVAKAAQNEEALDNLVQVSQLCTFIGEAMARVQASFDAKDEVAYDAHVFCAKQLITIAGSLDVQHDQTGRQNLTATLLAFLPRPSTADELVSVIVLALQRAASSESMWLNQAFACIDELVPPVLDAQDQAELEQIKRELDALRKLKREHVLREEYEEAAALKGKEADLEVRRKALEPSPQAEWQPRRVLAILSALLKYSKRSSPQTTAAVSSVILPGFTSPDTLVRLAAVECLALFSLLDSGVAASHGLPALTACMDNADEVDDVRVCAVKGLFDLLIVHGTDEAHWESLLSSFMGFLHHAEAAHVAAQGLCKLLFCGRVADARVAQCLMVLLFHPSSERDPRVRQCLAVFFAEYALASPRNQRVVRDMALPTVQTVIRPAPGSMTEEIVPAKLLAHLVYLLTPVDDGRENLLPSFAEGLCREIAADASFASVADVARAVYSIPIDGIDVPVLCRLLAVTNDALNSVDDATASQQLAKFRTALEGAGAQEIADGALKTELENLLSARVAALGGAGRKVAGVSKTKRIPRRVKTAPVVVVEASSDGEEDGDDDQ